MSKIVTVNFRSDELVAIERDDGYYVALRPICEAMGLSWGSQLQRVRRDRILSEGIVVMKTPLSRHGQEEVCMRIELVNGWVFSIDDSRVKDEETLEKVLAYKRECYQALSEALVGSEQHMV